MATSSKPQDAKPRDIDPSILTADERAAVELEAEEEVLKKAKDAAKSQLKKRLIEEQERKTGVAEPMVEVFIDLAPYCDRILINNRGYLQGQTYTVAQSVSICLHEIMQNTWRHQSIVDGKSENFYRRSRSQKVIPAGNGAAVTTTSNLLRA